MKESIKKPENKSHTLDSNPKASRQKPMSEVLQAYKSRMFGMQVVQCESIEDEDILQVKISDQASERIVSQRYGGNIQEFTGQDDEFLQGKSESIPTTGKKTVQQEEKTNNTGLPDDLKTGIENLSGYSMDDVCVHYNSNTPEQLNALAYTQGTDIHIAPGQEKHLPHEAWHVVQQKQGRVQPTMQMQGVHVNNNVGLEKEADEIGAKANNYLFDELSICQLKNKSINSIIIQRVIKINEETQSIQELKEKFHQFVKKTNDVSPFLEYDFHIEEILIQLSNLNASFNSMRLLMDLIEKRLLDQINFEETSFNLNQIFMNNGVDYVIQGSYAARLYGAPIDSGDIDYIVSDLKKAKQLLDRNCNYKTNGGSMAVLKYKNINTNVEIDISYNSEFGISVSHGVRKGGVKILPLTEVLKSLCLRPEKRSKEKIAFQYLVDYILPTELKSIYRAEGKKYKIYEDKK